MVSHGASGRTVLTFRRPNLQRGCDMSPNDRGRDKPFERLIAIMETLRSETGCPWDRAQDASTLRPYVIEEAYEVVDAIEGGDANRLCEELGDLLLQIVFHAQLGREEGTFDIDDVCRAIGDKMVRRHPRVFGQDPADGPQDEEASWEQIKAKERAALDREDSVLEGVPAALPALLRAFRIADKASNVGFDWPDVSGVLDKVREEVDELVDATEGKGDIEHEYGDLLFALANLGRFLEVDPETALQRANGRFIRRFGVVERGLRGQGRPLQEASLEEMEALWEFAKHQECG